MVVVPWERRTQCRPPRRTKRLATSTQGLNELLGTDTSLLEHASKCSGLELTVIGDDATTDSASQDNVTSTLAGNHEPESFQRSDGLRTGDSRQSRHSRSLETS
jgi:hypothetical protein